MNTTTTRTFTAPSTVHRMDHTGRGVQQGPQHGCEAAAVAAAELLRAKDRPTPLNPRPVWWVASLIEGTGRYEIKYL